VAVNCRPFRATSSPRSSSVTRRGVHRGHPARLGRFELADGGTLFLDEVGDLSPEIQVALLRVLQEREFERVGRSAAHQKSMFVSSSRRIVDLTAAIEGGAFRQDLFYRLNVFPVAVPPLRERREDIPLWSGTSSIATRERRASRSAA